MIADIINHVRVNEVTMHTVLNVRLLTFARTAVTDDLTTPFDTTTVFWVECDPDTEPFNYRVVAVSRTINQVVLALAEVENDEAGN